MSRSCSEDGYPVLISNAEVLQRVEKRIKDRAEAATGSSRKPNRRYQHRDWVEEQVAAYFQYTSPIRVDRTRYKELQDKLQAQKKQHVACLDDAASPSPSSSSGSALKSTGFGLTQAEAIQILNFMPTEPVEIHLMIEELHSRMPEKQQQELLEAIAFYRVATNVANETDGGADSIEAKNHDGDKVMAKEEEDAQKEDVTVVDDESSNTVRVKQEMNDA